MSGTHQKSLQHRAKAGATPDAGDLAAIRALALRDFEPGEIVVRECDLAHNCIDRDKECFDDALLDEFSRSIIGKGVFLKGHPAGWRGDGAPGDGRVFAASVESMTLEQARIRLREPNLTLPPDRSMVKVLKTKTYYANTDDMQPFHTKADLGIVGDISLGFNYSDMERVKGADGIELNVFRYIGPGEALEQSYVWLGAQPGMRATKGATTHTTEDDAMSAELTQKLATADITIKTLQPKADGLDAIKSALGADAALADDPTALAQLAQHGKAARDAQIETCVRYDRTVGKTLGDDPAAVEEARKDYAAMPARALKSLSDRYAAAMTDASTSKVEGSDPNKDTGTGDGQKAAAPGAFASPIL